MKDWTTQPLYILAFQQKLHYFYDVIRLSTQLQVAAFCAEELCHFCQNKD